jgi:hypothetical protein
MKCPCGEKVPFSRRGTLKQVLELNAALTRAAEHEDLINDMSRSRGTSLAMTRDLALQRGEDPDTVWPSEEDVQEAIIAERSDTWKLGHAVLEQLHEVAHGRAGMMASEHDLQAIKLNLMAGPGGPHFLTEDDVRRLQNGLQLAKSDAQVRELQEPPMEVSDPGLEGLETSRKALEKSPSQAATETKPEKQLFLEKQVGPLASARRTHDLWSISPVASWWSVELMDRVMGRITIMFNQGVEERDAELQQLESRRREAKNSMLSVELISAGDHVHLVETPVPSHVSESDFHPSNEPYGLVDIADMGPFWSVHLLTESGTRTRVLLGKGHEGRDVFLTQARERVQELQPPLNVRFEKVGDSWNMVAL